MDGWSFLISSHLQFIWDRAYTVSPTYATAISYSSDMKLFDGLTFRIVDSEVTSELVSIIEENGGYVSDFLLGQELSISDPLIQDGDNGFVRGPIVISATIDFPEYGYLEDNMVSIVSPDWVHTCVEKKLLAPLRPFSPDPKYVLSRIFVCVSDSLSIGDQEALYGGVGALGGLFADAITPYTTHLITLTMDDPKAQLVSQKLPLVKIVLPHWIDDCLKLRKRLDETPYLFPDPPILSGHAGEVPDQQDGLYLSSPDTNVAPPVSEKSTVFKGKTVCFGLDLELSSRGISALKKLVITAGGKTTDDVTRADIYIGQYRDGSQYLIASDRRLFVGNLTWLYCVVFHDQWVSPLRRLLHYPIARYGIPAMRSKVICITNYTGEARRFLEQLIVASGAKYTKKLTNNNTHLIAATPNGHKFIAARKWGLQIINHLWLEESYASFDVQPESLPRYSQIAARLNLNMLVGQTHLIQATLKPFYNNVEITEVLVDDSDNQEQSHHIKESANQPEPNQEDEETFAPAQPRETHPIESVTIATVGSEKSRSVSLSNTAEQEESEGNKTVEGLPVSENHAAGDSLIVGVTEEPNGHFEGERDRTEQKSIASSNRKRELSQPTTPLEPVSKKLFVDQNQEQIPEPKIDVPSSPMDAVHEKITKISPSRVPEPARRSPSVLTSNPSSPSKAILNVMITGVDEEYDTKSLRKVRIRLVNAPEKVTIMVAPRVLRTEKFLCAMSFAEHIVSPKYLDDCLIKNRQIWPVPDWYHLKDDQLTLALSRAANLRKAHKKLFDGLTFNVVSNIKGGIPVFDHIVRSHGAGPSHEIKSTKTAKFVPSTWQNQEVFVFITGESSKASMSAFEAFVGDRRGIVHDFEWVISCIRDMQLDLSQDL